MNALDSSVDAQTLAQNETPAQQLAMDWDLLELQSALFGLNGSNRFNK